MAEVIRILLGHAYAVLFLWVFAEQIGLPLPAAPLLLAAGALAGAGELNPAFAIGFVAIASLAADLFWYYVGRHKGSPVLRFLCRVSLEPDSCVRSTQEVFSRHGAHSLVIAKFIPGLNTVAPPLAGISRMRLSRFVLFDTLGALLWAAVFTGLGYFFAGQIEYVAASAQRLGGISVVILMGGLVAYVAWKYVRRRRFLRQLRMARISPEELKEKLDAGEAPLVVDLRHSLDFSVEPYTIPGALCLPAEELGQRHQEIPRDREVILY